MSMQFQSGLWREAKRFLIIFLPLIALIIGISMIVYDSEIKSVRSIHEARGANAVSLAEQLIVGDLGSVVSDLMILSEMSELGQMLESGDAADREALSRAFISYSRRKGLYGQIRFLDETGMEVVRIDFNGGTPASVKDDELQSKGARYYFSDAFRLEQGGVFVSPLDLNIEQGKIERPLKPVIRFGTPVFDRHGRKRGIVLLNYLAATMFHTLDDTHVSFEGQLMLLNREGFWLKGPTPEHEWGFMFEERQRQTFGNAFPEAWRRISEAESAQFYDADGLFSFRTVSPVSEAQRSSTGSGEPFEPSAAPLASYECCWKLVSRLSPEVLSSVSRRMRGELLSLDAILVLLVAIGCLFVARAGVKRKEVEEQYRVLFESSRDAIMTLEPPAWRFTAANPATVSMFGTAGEHDFLAHEPWDLSPEQQPDGRASDEKASTMIEMAMREGSHFFEWTHRRIGGEEFPANVLLTRVEVGGRSFLQATVRDITDQKLAEADKQALEIELRQRQKMAAVGALARGAGHEINNPINGIMNYAQLIKDQLAPDSPVGEFASEIIVETERIESVTHDLLSFAAEESAARGPAHLDVIVESTLAPLRATLTRDKIEIMLDVPDGLPTITCNNQEIEQVLASLLSNARDALNEKYEGVDENKRLYISARERGVSGESSSSPYRPSRRAPRVRLTIEDRGSGIPAQLLARVFEPFVTTKDRSIGAGSIGKGMGLFIGYAIVEAHGGRLSVESEVGEWTRFHVDLPVTDS